MKNINADKYYKSYFIKKLRLDFNEDKESKFYSQKFNSNNILKDVDNIEKIEKKQRYHSAISNKKLITRLQLQSRKNVY